MAPIGTHPSPIPRCTEGVGRGFTVHPPFPETYLDRVYLGRVKFLRMAIQSFAGRAIERFFVDGTLPRGVGWTRIAGVASRKLDMMDYAERLPDLASPPGNRLEALKGDLTGLHSIRINNQWRIIFRWTDMGPADVDIRNYH